MFFLLLLISFKEIFLQKVIYISAFFFGRAAGATVALARHRHTGEFKEFVLVGRGDVHHIVGNQFGAYAVFGDLNNAVGVDYWRLFYLHSHALRHAKRWFHGHIVYQNATCFTGVCGYTSGLVKPHGP